MNKTKEAFVKEHPETRDKVFRQRADGEGGAGRPRTAGPTAEEIKQLYDKSGRLRDPTRSAYYDPVYNPFGVPPPGMPYKDRGGFPWIHVEAWLMLNADPLPGEYATGSDSDDDDEDAGSDEDSDEEIIMPEGLPPGARDSDADSDDSDDIPLPAGPPPARSQPNPPSAPTGPRNSHAAHAPVRPTSLPFAPPLSGHTFHPPPHLPVRPGGYPQTYGAGPSVRPFPQRPPQTIQDPLSNQPGQTYQAYHARPPHAPHALPPRPPSARTSAQPAMGAPPPSTSSATATTTSAPSASAEISAEPQLRDLRKEATAFVPRGVKRKKAPPGGVAINAAPGSREIDEAGDEIRARPGDTGAGGGLMDRLQGVFATQAEMKEVNGTSGTGPGTLGRAGVKGGDEEYRSFVKGLEDI